METIKIEDRATLMHGDCCERIAEVESESVHLSFFSPPFAELYVYSDDYRDMGNCKNNDEFYKHFNYLTPELHRVMMPGRLVGIHCMFLPIMKGKEGFLGFRNFPYGIQQCMENAGFVLHGPPTTIWKDPVIEMQRTKAIGLLNKQKDKDATLSRTGNPDFIYWFRKLGDNPVPVKHSSVDPKNENYLPVDLWQKYASPVWYDINYSETLNKEGKEDDDVKHIAPLQLQTIARAVHLYTNPGETVFTPFGGIGSEPYQSLKLNRNAIAIELKQSYFEVMVKNCRNVLQKNSQLSLI
jgi:DNA modification methylase